MKSKHDVRILNKELKQMHSQLAQYHENFFDLSIKQAWESLQHEAMINHLKEMPIDTLSIIESGLPINMLRENGYHYINDLVGISVEQLQNIPGVGPLSAPVIFTAVTKIQQSTREDIVPKIDPDHLSEKGLLLLKQLYRKIVLQPQVPAIKNQLEQFEKDYQPSISFALRKKGFLGRLFQSNEVKQSINEAFDQLNAPTTQQQYTAIIEKIDRLENLKVSDEAVIEHYVEENISYYVALERIIGVDPSKESDELPSEIVDTINDFPLDTKGLSLDLRSYQRFGAKYALHFKRTLLGDEMGLGKTVQALALINHLYNERKQYSIVVCPLSLLSNWRREIERFSSIPTFTFHGNQRTTEFNRWRERKGVLLTTYEQMAHLLQSNSIEDMTVNAIIVDEAHYIKNPEAKRSKNVYEIAKIADYALFMSGTPLENRVDEMKQLIAVLRPDIGEQLSNALYLLEPKKFKKTIQEVYLRRNRQEVLGELPELEMIEERVAFGPEEHEVYREAVMGGQLMLMRRSAWLGGSPEKSPKLEKLLAICKKAEENGYKVLVFSFFRDVLKTIHTHLGDQTYEIINGDVPNKRRQEIIDTFSKTKKGKVLLAQITAGGVGLNIQAANIVILCEPQWKPSIENQAISRVYRMGQSRKVFVYRLITENSIDESMLDVLDYKTEVFELYARDSQITDVTASHDPKDDRLQQQVLEMEKERILNPPKEAFKWPTTELSGVERRESDNELREQSDLLTLGYQITDTTKIDRWKALEKAVPALGLKKVAYTIAHHVKLRKGQQGGEIRYRNAITKWEEDLVHLKKVYYKGNFRWPETTVGKEEDV